MRRRTGRLNADVRRLQALARCAIVAARRFAEEANSLSCESGKSNGQFYTPAEVSRVMAKAVGVGSARNANQANRQMAQADHKRRRRVCSKVSDGLLVVCDGRAKVRKESVSLSREHATYP